MRIKMLLFKDGERFPVLLGENGVPLYFPTVYATSMRRQIGMASATIKADLSAINLLYIWAHKNEIDLETRFLKGLFLNPDEIGNLADAAKSRLDLVQDDIPLFHPGTTPPKQKKSRNIRSLEKFRMLEPSRSLDSVSSKTAARRLYSITLYLDWLAETRTAKVLGGVLPYDQTVAARKQMKASLMARIPEFRRDINDPREGLSEADQDLLLEVIHPASPRNPWKGDFVKHRNQLIIHLLIELGPRRGEILLLRTQRDIDVSSNILKIMRVPDDKDDPRVDEPNAKTLPRDLPISLSLAAMLTRYILTIRKQVPAARFHDYLIVAEKTGRPLSKGSMTKIFATLRESVPELPQDLCAHLLRHTWNDNFSKECDEANVSEEEEQLLRNYLAGWNKGSKMAATYTRRHVKKKAQEVSLKLQENLQKRKKVKDEV